MQDSYYSADPITNLIVLALVVLVVVALWKMFEKADEPGWKAIIPLYNTYTMFRIAGRSGWMFLLLLIPLVNIFVSIMVSLDLAKMFGRSAVFGFFGLFLFPFVGYTMLGFNSDEYVGPKHD